MIFLFRKEIRKWNTVWWVVLASLFFGFGGASFYMLRQPSKRSIKVAKIDGHGISLQEYQHVYAEMSSSLNDLAMYWGIPVDRLAQAMGMKDIAAASINKCIQNVLLDRVWGDFSMKVDDESFQDFLAKTVSRAFIDRSGRLNVRAYQNYLSKLHMSVADYEKSKEREYKRNTIVKAMEQVAYVPKKVVAAKQAQKNMKKRFAVLNLPFETFLAQAKETPMSDNDLQAFFKKNKEHYRVNEKRMTSYWVLTPEEYKDKVEVSDNLIERYYEKNKSSLFRIPPKVKLKTVVFKAASDATDEVVESTRREAEALRAKVIEAPERFVELGKDKIEELDYFQRGTHDPDLEKAAFLTLKQNGDISDVVKTERGFEIIQLVDRIAASEKPLSMVRDEIIKDLIDRKAIIVLKRDLDAVLRTARTDKSIFGKFAGINKLKTHKSDWMTKEDGEGYELLDALAQHVFSDGSAARFDSGYFVHRGQHILYKIDAREKSYIPDYETVKARVEQDWYAEQAEKLQDSRAKQLRADLFDKKMTIEQASKAPGFTIIKTALIGKDDEVEALKDAGNIVSEAFLLNDPSQVLSYKHKTDCYLVKLEEQMREDLAEKVDDKLLADTEKRREKQRYLDGFIASLQRDAKIEVDQALLKKGSAYY